jgi:hypothetical protein
LEDELTPRKLVPISTNAVFPQGNLTLTKVDELPSGAIGGMAPPNTPFGRRNHQNLPTFFGDVCGGNRMMHHAVRVES